MKKLLLLLPLILSGCAGSGPNGSWTPSDTSATVGAINQGVDVYNRVSHPEYYRPAPTVIVP